MRVYRSLVRLACPTGLWGFGLLLLLGLAACSPSGQPAAVPTPHTGPDTSATQAATAAPAPTSAPAAQATSPAAPALPAQPTVAAQLPTPRRAPLATAAPTSAPAPAASQDWQTYRNEQAGYSVAYPPDWRATELSAVPGQFITSFGPGGGAGISVAVRMLDSEQREPIDLPNSRCKPVTVGGAPATRCFDTISFSTATIVAGRGRQFTIRASGRRLDQSIYQRFLDSFRFIG